jgi:hypothetical protein
MSHTSSRECSTAQDWPAAAWVQRHVCATHQVDSSAAQKFKREDAIHMCAHATGMHALICAAHVFPTFCLSVCMWAGDLKAMNLEAKPERV